MNIKTINTISRNLLWFSAIAFLLLFFILSYYNRAASDDIVFAATVKKEGFVLALTNIYNLWSGRWASWAYLFALLSSADNFQNLHYFILIYHSITIVILIYSVSAILKVCIKKVFNTTIHSTRLLLYSILFISGFYYSTFNHIEVWWWISASVYYLQGIIFLLFGIALLLNENKKVPHYIFICMCFLYVGASFELYIFIISTILVLTSAYMYFANREMWTKIKKSIYFNGIVLAVICFAVSAAICFIAPGNYERRLMFNTEIVKDSVFSISSFFQIKYLVYFALAIIFVLLGEECKNNCTLRNWNIRRVLFFSSLPFLISLAVSFLFQYFILYGKQIPLRGLTFTSFSFHCFLSILFFSIGYHFNFKNIFWQLQMKIILPCFILIALLFTIYKQYNYVNKYSAAYDKQLEDLIEARKNKAKEFYVTPLPESGMLIYLYMNGYTAKPLAMLLNIDFEIKLKK